MIRCSRNFLAATGALAAVSIFPSCGKSHEAKITIVFPSPSAAAATETLETSVFAVTRDDSCEDIFERRRTKQSLPAPLFATGAVRTCDMLNGRANAFDVGFGNRAFLVVGKTAGEEIVMGCEVTFVDDRTTEPIVRLTLFDVSRALPPTMCTSLSDRCAGRCE